MVEDMCPHASTWSGWVPGLSPETPAQLNLHPLAARARPSGRMVSPELGCRQVWARRVENPDERIGSLHVDAFFAPRQAFDVIFTCQTVSGKPLGQAFVVRKQLGQHHCVLL